MWDEVFDQFGSVRDHYRRVIDHIGSIDLDQASISARDFLHEQNVTFHTNIGIKPFVVDLIPRIISSDEWQRVERGLTQRVEALNEFLKDVYSDQRIIAEGVVPREVVEGAECFEPDLVGSVPDSGALAHVSGLDLVRGSDGVLQVLEDNLRSPSGLTFAMAARRMTDNVLDFGVGFSKLNIEGVLDALMTALRDAGPSGSGDPSIALVSDGPSSAAWYEHRMIADALDIDLISIDHLERRKGRIYSRVDRRLKPIDVIYRRTDLDRLRLVDGSLTYFGELLMEPLQNGSVASVNAFGTGVADDKLVHSYVEDIVRFYLNQEPILESVTTYNPADPEVRAMVLSRIDELVVKPRGGLGGEGVVIGPRAKIRELKMVTTAVATEPEKWVAQETVRLSTHPTVVKGLLEPRHIDLRPYAVISKDGVKALPSCLTRVALNRGELVVNSSRNGGGKDTWIAQ